MFGQGKYTYQIQDSGRSRKATVTITEASESMARVKAQNIVGNFPKSGYQGYINWDTNNMELIGFEDQSNIIAMSPQSTSGQPNWWNIEEKLRLIEQNLKEMNDRTKQAKY